MFRHALVKLLARGPMQLLAGSRGGLYGIESDENGQRIKTDTARKLHRLALVEFSIRDNGVFLTLSDRGRAVAATLSEEK